MKLSTLSISGSVANYPSFGRRILFFSPHAHSLENEMPSLCHKLHRALRHWAKDSAHSDFVVAALNYGCQ